MEKAQLYAQAHNSRTGIFVIIEKSQEECICVGNM